VSTGPLQGLPISVKDLFAAGGYPCFAGSSRRLPADPWERDGPLVATLRRQLGVIMGKTHLWSNLRSAAPVGIATETVREWRTG
jgi:Asp-tRNA(Asn)/Glu-tRNA(Gln) amidotransferase A subunit family amidase